VVCNKPFGIFSLIEQILQEAWPASFYDNGFTWFAPATIDRYP